MTVPTMKWKESIAVYHPLRFLQVMFQILVIFALFGIGLSDDKTPETKETTSVVTSSVIPTLPAIRIDKSLPDLQYGSNDKDSINFVLYPPVDHCYSGNVILTTSFDFSLPGYEPLVIEWISFQGISLSVYEQRNAGKINEDRSARIRTVSMVSVTGSNNEVKMSIPRHKGNNKIKLTPSDISSQTTFECKEDIVEPFKFSYSNVKTKDGCELKIELCSGHNHSKYHYRTCPVVLWFDLRWHCLLLVLLIAGLFLYFMWWRKRGTDKEEEKEKEIPRSPGISPETMAKLLAMKPKVFPLTEKQKQIKAGAMAEEDDYPTEVSDDSGFGPVQSDPDSKKKKSESTSDQSSNTDSKRRSSKSKSTKKMNGNTP